MPSYSLDINFKTEQMESTVSEGVVTGRLQKGALLGDWWCSVSDLGADFMSILTLQKYIKITMYVVFCRCVILQ